MTARSVEARPDLAPLTSLRFVAALLVFVYHAPATNAFGSYYALGHAGVGFFFVLSGFILTYSYRRTFAAGVTRTALRTFYAARFARIYPAYAVATCFAVVVLLTAGEPLWNHSSNAERALAFVAQLALVQSWVPLEPIYLGVNAPAWSLSTEAFFYAVFPLLAHTLWRYVGDARAWKIAIAAAVIWGVPTAAELAAQRASVWSTYIAPPVRLVDFAIGVLAAIVYARLVRQKPVRGWATATEALALAVVVVTVALSPSLPSALRYALYLIPAWSLLIVVMGLGAGAFSRILRAPILVRLGKLSFAFYLLHWPIVLVLGRVSAARSVLGFVSMFALTLAASWALYSFVEQPLRRRLRARADLPIRLRVTAPFPALRS